MRNLCLLLTALTLPACAAAADGRARDTLPGPVTYEVRSWGRILLRWQVRPDGTGEIWRSSERKDPAEVRKFRLRLEGNPWRTFIADAEEARAATRGGVACKKEIFDLPYGSIVWDYPGARQEYRFDAGCRSDKADEVQDILTAADTVVETMARIDSDPYVVEPAR